ncbi:hypothetical protein PP641_gp002 [Arthrobacter phage SilentRX]|uniref:Uncharacterized protein n=1 Tax=Arthrobacter phage SilentRX TaxID=2836091 RepID=A0A8F3IP52_9CAUD|nr:hypothetical protein PP641_gp002 [Arthrobacter phage SilentRX]QWY82748.1 hypothetical protein SEA_SILENTRX_2 [Arthrobacter phage SilentRX]
MAEHNLGISTVMAGQTFQSTEDEATVAIADAVTLTAYIDGHPIAGFMLTPEEAVALGQGLIRAAGTLISAEVTDDGTPLSPLARLNRLRQLFKDA